MGGLETYIHNILGALHIYEFCSSFKLFCKYNQNLYFSSVALQYIICTLEKWKHLPAFSFISPSYIFSQAVSHITVILCYMLYYTIHMHTQCVIHSIIVIVSPSLPYLSFALFLSQAEGQVIYIFIDIY